MPESTPLKNEKSQAFGRRPKASLAALVFGRNVEVVGNKTDRYTQTIAKIMVADPGCQASNCPKVNDAELIHVGKGMGWWYRKYAQEQSLEDRAAYEVAQLDAKAMRLG